MNIKEDFFLEELNLDKVFALLSRADFYLLSQIQQAEEASEREEGVYLSELAGQWHIAIAETSRILKRLEAQGYIYWTFDPDKERTWIRLTETAHERMDNQKDNMAQVYDKVLEHIPSEKLKITFETMKTIQSLIDGHEIFV